MKIDLSEILTQLGEERDKYFRAVSPPIIQTSNFCFSSVNEMRENLCNEFDVPFYTRGNNPTVTILRKKIAALEYAEDALITSSGCAAITASVISNLKSGDHVICVKNCYSWTYTLLKDILGRFGVETDFIDGTDIANFKNALKSNTRLIYLESPTSFMFELQDIEAVANFAHQNNLITIIDNSYSTPLYQNPLLLGIDIVVHSASKYINGHTDVVAGVICSNSKMIKKIFSAEYLTFGGIISPENAFLIIRGLRTLQIRMQRTNETGAKVVSFLENHPKIENVLYPFSPKHPQFELAKKQKTGCGGMFSFIIKTDSIEKVDKFCNTLKRFLLTCSWGGHESLFYPASVLYSSNNNNKTTLPFNLIRMYTGLENPDDLISDIENALNEI